MNARRQENSQHDSAVYKIKYLVHAIAEVAAMYQCQEENVQLLCITKGNDILNLTLQCMKSAL